MRRTALNMVHELARRDARVVYMGSDPGSGTLDAMKQEFPERFFIEGISEANVVGMAAGLAMEGFVPYVNTIATFLTRRCFEQVAIDLCLHELPVRLIGNGGGLVYAPLGPTHTATEDMAIMRALPGMAIVAPADADEMGRFMKRTLDWPGPIYIRLAKGGDPIVSCDDDGFEIGKAIVRRRGSDVAIVASGVMVHHCLLAAERLAADGISCGVVNMHTVKPLDVETLFEAADAARLLVTAEEHSLVGGLGGAVAEALADRGGGAMPPLLRLGLPDAFIHNYGSQDGLLEMCGLTPAAIAARIGDRLA
jgi:transketolase